MEQKVTIKSTKNQIMDAYNELLKKLQTQKTEEPKKVQAEQQKTRVKMGEIEINLILPI